MCSSDLMSPGDNPHVLLGRIRFLNKCIECFRKNELVPECLCYVPKEVCYKICKDSSSNSTAAFSSSASISAGKTLVSVWESPHQTPHSKKLYKYNIEPKKGTCIRTTGEEYCNSQGLWVKINKVGFAHPAISLQHTVNESPTCLILFCSCVVCVCRCTGAAGGAPCRTGAGGGLDPGV